MISITPMSGIFYCGDNLELLTVLDLVPAESVDLVYLDPPFNSQRTFNIVYKDSRAQAEAFKDHWSWEEAAPQYGRLLEATDTPPKLRTLLRGLHDLLIDEDSDLLAYLAMMAPRVFALHRVLKPSGSLYLHCDPTASHYLKLILDGVFGSGNCLSEVIWKRTHNHGDPSRTFGAITDTILFYGKGQPKTFNPQFRPFTSDYATKRFSGRDDDGRRWQSVTLASPNPRPNLHYPYKASNGVTYQPHANGWKCEIEKMRAMDRDCRLHFPAKRGGQLRKKMYLDESPGVKIQNLWDDIYPLNSQAEERVGYPTQKPLALLQRIIEASSEPGDLVLDPFCGCGTTIEACARLGRRWIGIDIARKAVEVTEARFKKLGLEAPEIEWYPPDLDAAQALAARSGIKFEEWVRRKIRAARRRKHDRGIDGESYFRDAENKLWHVLVSVKGGKLNPAMVRELRGTLEREHAAIGVLVTMNEPSKEMRLEATHAGFLKVSDAEGPIPRLQIVTAERLFSERPAIRAPGVNVTEMPKPVVPAEVPEQLALRLEPPKPPRKATKRSEEKARPAAEEAPASSRKSGRPGR
jgi:site-specific DNA-methyltransferase (adenine-specific)